MGIILARSSPTSRTAARPSPGLLAGEGHFSSAVGELGLLRWPEYLVNCCTRMRKRNPLLFNAQPACSEELAVGALLFGGEVGKCGGAVAGVGDGQVLECGDGGGVHEQ